MSHGEITGEIYASRKTTEEKKCQKIEKQINENRILNNFL